jgi:hypothetical protein
MSEQKKSSEGASSSVETKMKMLVCSTCHYETPIKAYWDRHLLSWKHQHGGQTKSKILKANCEKCGVKFSTTTNMKQHMLVHHSSPQERKKQYKFYCDVCDYGSFAKPAYEQHVLTRKHRDRQPSPEDSVVLSSVTQ